MKNKEVFNGLLCINCGSDCTAYSRDRSFVECFSCDFTWNPPIEEILKDSDLRPGKIIPPGNFVLVRPIETMSELSEFLNKYKSIFYRHRMYPTAFIISQQYRHIFGKLKAKMFWVTDDLRETIKQK